MSNLGGSRRSVVGPVILIGLGVLFLLQNLNLLPWSFWESLSYLWPVLLIAFGVEIVLGRQSSLGSLLAVVLVLGLVAAVVFAASPGLPLGQEWARWAAWGPITTERVSQPLGGATQAEIQLDFGAGGLRVGALDDAALLVDGQAAVSGDAGLDQDYAVRGNTAYLRLGQNRGRVGRFWARGREGDDQPTWDLLLNKATPMRLKISTGVGTAAINLSELQVRNLDLNTGVGKTEVTLPGRGLLEAEIASGIGETVVTIPAGTAARVRVRTGIGAAEVLGNFQRRDDEYVTPGYDSASDRIDLRVNGGIGKVQVQLAAR